MRKLHLTRNDINQQPHCLKLSRMGGELSGMLSTLHSYRCEPCTPEMYDQFQELDQHGKTLKRKIDQTQIYCKEDLMSSKKVDERIRKVMSEYDLFQKQINSYFTEAVLHH